MAVVCWRGSPLRRRFASPNPTLRSRRDLESPGVAQGIVRRHPPPLMWSFGVGRRPLSPVNGAALVFRTVRDPAIGGSGSAEWRKSETMGRWTGLPQNVVRRCCVAARTRQVSMAEMAVADGGRAAGGSGCSHPWMFGSRRCGFELMELGAFSPKSTKGFRTNLSISNGMSTQARHEPAPPPSAVTDMRRDRIRNFLSCPYDMASALATGGSNCGWLSRGNESQVLDSMSSSANAASPSRRRPCGWTTPPATAGNTSST